MAAREPWAVELALEPSGTETTWQCRNAPAGLPRRSVAEMGATRPQDCGTCHTAVAR